MNSKDFLADVTPQVRTTTEALLAGLVALLAEIRDELRLLREQRKEAE